MSSSSAAPKRTAPDAAIRARVVDPRQSFIVQAPAGSGKTELLTQRMLRALTQVEQPESVLAITFTRKAASEMRNRILGALADSQKKEHDQRPHKLELRRLAQALAEHEAKFGWKLLDNPQRLQVRTVDSFCESVARQLPMLAGVAGEVEITEDASQLYGMAADRTIALLADESRARESAAVAALLAYLDNRVGDLRQLLSSMLARRDQWLEKLGNSASLTEAQLGELRARLRDSIENAIRDELESARGEMSGIVGASALATLLGYVKTAADLADAGSPLARLRDLTDLPPADCAALPQWRALRTFCLTGKNELRKRFNANEGGLSGPSATECGTYFKEVLAASPESERLQQLLKRVGLELPDPAYSDAEWEFVRALLIVLPVCVAYLNVIQAEQGLVDFTAMSMAATTALRTPEGPTELGLAMGARIRHVLIDEFQDTSVSQVRLLKALVQGWDADDNCSIFAVGDPMQSIYAFREAEVANFTSAVREQQVADIAVEPERLTANFRSQAGLIDWFNAVFPRVFAGSSGPHGNELLGAVEHSPATASEPALEGAAVGIHGFAPKDYVAEAECVAQLAQQALAETDSKVAILVRARAHLRHIVTALKVRGIPYRAVKIDALGARQTVIDLDAIARALINVADRAPWLAVLRAPWCGLTLADLWELCRGDRDSSVLELLHRRMRNLSADGQQRAGRVLTIMESALADNGRVPLSLRVERAWIQLGGPASLDPEQKNASVNEAQIFFQLLQECEAEQVWPGSTRFQQKLEQLFAPADTTPGIRLDVMTIHNAKGLEWDTVIVPALGRAPQQDDKQLLYWRQRLRDGEDELLLAPMCPAGKKDDVSIEKYLRDLLKQRSVEESKRLLYVACTRAKKRLHLTATLPENGKARSTSLLNLLWPIESVRKQFENITASEAEPYTEGSERKLSIRRLPSEWNLPETPEPLAWEPASLRAEPKKDHTFEWASNARRLTGTVTHAFLQQIAREGLEKWDEARVLSVRHSIRASLLGAGIPESAVNAAVVEVERALVNTLTDPQGRWLLSRHNEASSEMAITMLTDEGIVDNSIDRTFVADGVRWIVDFKITEIEGGSPEAYFDAQVEKYRRDMERYRDAMRLMDSRPIKCALYFPLQRKLRMVID